MARHSKSSKRNQSTVKLSPRFSFIRLFDGSTQQQQMSLLLMLEGIQTVVVEVNSAVAVAMSAIHLSSAGVWSSPLSSKVRGLPLRLFVSHSRLGSL